MGSCNSAALYTNGGEIVIRIGAGGHAVEAAAAIKVGGEGGILLQGVERPLGNSLLFLGPAGLGGGGKLDGVLLNLHGEIVEGGHHSFPPLVNNLKGTSLTTERERGLKVTVIKQVCVLCW